MRTWKRVSGAIEALAPTRVERLAEGREFRGYVVEKRYETPWRGRAEVEGAVGQVAARGSDATLTKLDRSVVSSTAMSPATQAQAGSASRNCARRSINTTTGTTFGRAEHIRREYDRAAGRATRVGESVPGAAHAGLADATVWAGRR